MRRPPDKCTEPIQGIVQFFISVGKHRWETSAGAILFCAFLNIGAITPLGAAPAGYAQQCPRCDNSSSEVGLHKIPCTWGELSTA